VDHFHFGYTTKLTPKTKKHFMLPLVPVLAGYLSFDPVIKPVGGFLIIGQIFVGGYNFRKQTQKKKSNFDFDSFEKKPCNQLIFGTTTCGYQSTI
jgi:hypothetical protein